HRLEQVKLLPPVIPSILYAAGPNYRGDREGMAKRRGEPPKYPARPEPKLRSVHAIIGTEDEIVVPKESTGAVQPEGQLAVVIGKKARNVSREEALDCGSATASGTTSASANGRRPTAPCSAPRTATRSSRSARSSRPGSTLASSASSSVTTERCGRTSPRLSRSGTRPPGFTR